MSGPLWFSLVLVNLVATGVILHYCTGNRSRLAMVPLAGAAICLFGAWGSSHTPAPIRTLPNLGTPCGGSLIIVTKNERQTDRIFSGSRLDWLNDSFNAQTGCSLSSKGINIGHPEYEPEDCIFEGPECWLEQSLERQLEMEIKYGPFE